MSTDTSTRAGLREWLGLAVLALPTVLLALDLTVLHLALPHLGADLGASNTELLWITDVYAFMVAGALITMGTLGDRIGRRRLLLIGAAAFTAASVLAAYSTSPEMLIATRALLGLAGATLGPSTLSLIGTMFRDPRQRSLAIGLWLTAFSLGGALGPAVGGILLEYFWWGSVFLLGVPVMVVLLVTGPLLLPEYRAPRPGRLDLVSVALSLAALLPVIYGVKEIARSGLGVVPVAAIVAGAVAGVVFVRRQRRIADPLLDLTLFGSRRFSGALVGLMLGAVTLYAFTFYFTQHLRLVDGLSPLRAGLWFVPLAMATVVAATVSPLLARRFRPERVIAGGLVVASVGFVALAVSDTGAGLPTLIGAGVAIGVGINPLLVLGTDLVVGSAPPDRTGSAAAISESGSELGAGVGIAAFGTLGTTVYGTEVAAAMPPEVPAEVAAEARDSIVGAFAVVADLPAPVGERLLAVAREAFVSGMGVVSGASAAVLVGTAVLVLVMLGRRT
ncbi:MFS transporter [Actinophytocola xinjiangensis]|uniref:MFS transporter n=1 Tax=Actinophytocola xinjiangensis TaxID=485602 RepID=A0A7Z0WI53_9PSEU|nr:MFS transporter [Actinophytocola xinjiangensis]OLF06692.1 MFS transporter [Actinophytocola xinjiangensis]